MPAASIVDTLLVVRADPVSDPANALAAFRHAENACQQGARIAVFFYGDGVSVANNNRLEPDDEPGLRRLWQGLHTVHPELLLELCSTAALRRGIADEEEARRHHLPFATLAPSFVLTSLGRLAELMHQATRVQVYG